MTTLCRKEFELVVSEAIPVPTAYWKLEEAAGDRVNSVGDANGDIAVLGPEPGNVPGIIGNALPFVATFEDFASPSAVLFNYDVTSPGITWTLWFQANPFGFPVEMTYYLAAWNLALVCRISESYIRAEMQGLTTNSLAIVNQVWTPGQWYFASVQFRLSTLKTRISIDAGAWTEAAATADIAGATTTPSQVHLSEIGVGPAANIVLDEMAIFINQVLGDASISFLYNGGAGRTYPF